MPPSRFDLGAGTKTKKQTNGIRNMSARPASAARAQEAQPVGEPARHAAARDRRDAGRRFDIRFYLVFLTSRSTPTADAEDPPVDVRVPNDASHRDL